MVVAKTTTKKKTANEKDETPVITMTAGMDIGNGYCKCKLKIDQDDPVSVDMPSNIAYTTGSNTPKVPTAEYMNDLPNKLEAQCMGPGIHSTDEGRMFFGKRAIESGESLTMFNITNQMPKNQDSLYSILLDSIIAASGVKKYWQDTGKLPENLRIAAGIAVPLPINDYINYRQQTRDTIMSGDHTVIIRNFAKPISVDIKYTSCVVVAEGAAAQYAIMKLGPEFLQKALDMARQHGANIDPAYTGEMLAKARNTISIDIGDGNTGFPVITNGMINVEVSRSTNRGYGTVLDGALADLANTPASFETRRDLSDFVLDPLNKEMPAQKHTYDLVTRTIEAHKEVYVRNVRTNFTDIFQKVGQRTQVIFVYGGGATPMQDKLEPILIQETVVGNQQNIPILWMDSKYSRYLNRNGLYLAAVNGVKASLQ